MGLAEDPMTVEIRVVGEVEAGRGKRWVVKWQRAYRRRAVDVQWT